MENDQNQKKGCVPGNYKHMGPFNPLEKQSEYDKNTGKVTLSACSTIKQSGWSSGTS